jgi:membrane protease YdiL (CAAX protease family)
MRAFLTFLGAIVGTLLLAAALAYPLYVVIHPLQPEWRFDKIAGRLWQLMMFGGLALVIRRLRLGGKRDWGYGLPGPVWRRQFATGVLAGLVTMLPVTVSLLALGLRPLKPELDAKIVVEALLGGALTGLAVGFLEETYFRGLFQGAVVRGMRSPALAILLVSVVFSALHFLANERIPHERVNWLSGLDLLRSLPSYFATPATVIDSFLSLAAVGALLGLVTWWTGSIALAVGLHAGWVWMIKATVATTTQGTTSPVAWLVNWKFDGYTGWLVLGWTLVLTAAVIGLRGRFAGWRDPRAG